ncbi:outer membrane lipoprotein carrier protein LolA [Curtobacterium sp. MCBD17_003]|uniref:LolA family protein n=1 Tax=Curtobacterium sp. MCBD17_003 TaxID=2175667 RepID=UPI001C653B41|nr:outer membrane lipoprotein carrier protein LolA [Curtobacterium sp. MCBD17_003]WIE55320.1 outer membrane lipoprotein carrier protein LolA [Curtobacterium sp. MCBD17_003]
MKKKSTWLPAVVAPVVVAGAVAAPLAASAATPSPATTGSHPTAAQVLASVAHSDTLSYSGRISQTSDLGLPSLPSTSGSSGASSAQSGASDVLDLLTASHEARVYVDGRSKARVQVLDQLAERDVIRNGRDVWTWDSKADKAVHVTLPSSAAAANGTDTGSASPADIAARAIAGITPSTRVGTPTTTSIAGHAAWQVRLTPKSSSTLVHDVVIAIDKSTGLPLSARIDARGQSTAAVSVRFSALSYGTPKASLFDFTPPSDAKVTTKDLSDAAEHSSTAKHPGLVAPGDVRASGAPTPSVQGDGWSSIVTLPAGTFPKRQLDADGSQLFGQLTKAVDGGRAVQTSLVSILITDDGRVLAGAVPVSALEAAAE